MRRNIIIIFIFFIFVFYKFKNTITDNSIINTNLENNLENKLENTLENTLENKLENTINNLGVHFEGGGFKTLYYLGVLKYFIDHNIVPKYYSGKSCGKHVCYYWYRIIYYF